MYIILNGFRFKQVQAIKEKHFTPEIYRKPVLHYWTGLFRADFKKGDSYRDLKATYPVNVLGFEYFACESCYSSFSILENKRHELFTDKLSIHIFELPKISRETTLSDHVLDWLRIIQADSEEALKMISENTENPMVRQAAGAILELNADDKLRQQVIDCQNALNDYYNDMVHFEEKGVLKEKKATAEKLHKKGWNAEDIAEFLGIPVVDVEIWLNAK